jgi:hypothetical protein
MARVHTPITDTPITNEGEHHMLISKDLEVSRQLRDQRLEQTQRRLDGAEEREQERTPSTAQLRAKVLSEGLAQARTETPKVGDFTGVGGIRVGVDLDGETEADRDVRLAAAAAERYQREVQSRRAVAAANRAGVEHLGVAPAEVDEDATLTARIKSLFGMRTKPGDPEPRVEIV